MPDNERPPDLRFRYRGGEYRIDAGRPRDEPAVEGGSEEGRALIRLALKRRPRHAHRMDGPRWAEEVITDRLPGADPESNLPPGAIP